MGVNRRDFLKMGAGFLASAAITAACGPTQDSNKAVEKKLDNYGRWLEYKNRVLPSEAEVKDNPFYTNPYNVGRSLPEDKMKALAGVDPQVRIAMAIRLYAPFYKTSDGKLKVPPRWQEEIIGPNCSIGAGLLAQAILSTVVDGKIVPKFGYYFLNDDPVIIDMSYGGSLDKYKQMDAKSYKSYLDRNVGRMGGYRIESQGQLEQATANGHLIVGVKNPKNDKWGHTYDLLPVKIDDKYIAVLAQTSESALMVRQECIGRYEDWLYKFMHGMLRPDGEVADSKYAFPIPPAVNY